MVKINATKGKIIKLIHSLKNWITFSSEIYKNKWN